MVFKFEMSNINFVEKYGDTGRVNKYAKPFDQNKLVQLSENKTVSHSSKEHVIERFFRQVFLPQGYPHSVSSDYFNYQFYDTIQAFCSRISGTIATKAILKGFGVGNAESTALAATITWIFKDGAAMFSSIMFAWWKGTEFDSDCKKWRFFADILNDGAMFIELLLPYFLSLSLPLLCVTACMQAAVGVAGSATRAAITQHQAMSNNSADVSAKDGSQEMAVNLIASVFGLVVLTSFDDASLSEWFIFFVFVLLHLYANYCAVSSLVFTGLNTERLNLVLQSYCRDKIIPTPEYVNRNESVLIGCNHNARKLFGFDIKLGQSLQTVTSNYNANDLDRLIKIQEQYVIAPDVNAKIMNVVLKTNETPAVVISAYFRAVLFSVCLCDLWKCVDIEREHFKAATIIDKYQIVSRIATKELPTFMNELQVKGWNLNSHSIQIDDWRLQ